MADVSQSQNLPAPDPGRRGVPASILKYRHNVSLTRVLELGASTPLTVDRAEISQSPTLLANLLFDKASSHVEKNLDVERSTSFRFDSRIDTSAAVTARRIFDFARRRYEVFRNGRTDENDSTTTERFVDFVRESVDRGFEEATGILDGLSILSADVRRDIDETRAALGELLEGFAASKSE